MQYSTGYSPPGAHAARITKDRPAKRNKSMSNLRKRITWEGKILTEFQHGQVSCVGLRKFHAKCEFHVNQADMKDELLVRLLSNIAGK
jgi:hypothetical protein